MDAIALLEKAWDKGAWCLVAVALGIFCWRVAKFLQPHIEAMFADHRSLISTLQSTSQLQAQANAANAAANADNADVLKQLIARPSCRGWDVSTPQRSPVIP